MCTSTSSNQLGTSTVDQHPGRSSHSQCSYSSPWMPARTPGTVGLVSVAMVGSHSAVCLLPGHLCQLGWHQLTQQDHWALVFYLATLTFTGGSALPPKRPAWAPGGGSLCLSAWESCVKSAAQPSWASIPQPNDVPPTSMPDKAIYSRETSRVSIKEEASITILPRQWR